MYDCVFHLRTKFIIVIIILLHCVFVNYLNLLRFFWLSGLTSERITGSLVLRFHYVLAISVQTTFCIVLSVAVNTTSCHYSKMHRAFNKTNVKQLVSLP